VMSRALGVELWNYTASNGASLKKGVEYVRPYNAAPATWPHQEKEVKEAGFMDDILALAAQLDAGQQ